MKIAVWLKPEIVAQIPRRFVGLVLEGTESLRKRDFIVFANRHYAGHGPATVKMFWDLWEKK